MAARGAAAAAVNDAGGAEEESDRVRQARRHIYDRAMELFEQQGFAGTSMSELAQACGVTKPTLYYYFRDKSQLLETLYEDVTAGIYAQMRAIAADAAPADARLRQAIVALATYNIRNRRFLAIFWRERHELNAPARQALAKLERQFESLVEGIVAEGIRDRLFRDTDARIATFGILGLLSTVQRWAPHAGAPPERVAGEVATMLLEGLAARPTPRRRTRPGPKPPP